MGTKSFETFENTIQKSNVWITEISDELDSADRHLGLQALRAVLHALRDRLTIEESADLAAQLPMLIRGMYFEGWHPSGKPETERHLEEFLCRVADGFTNNVFDIDAEQIALAVFKVMSKHISAGEIDDIRHMLPPELRALWPEPAAV